VDKSQNLPDSFINKITFLRRRILGKCRSWFNIADPECVIWDGRPELSYTLEQNPLPKSYSTKYSLKKRDKISA
jgi:hypothetical protein